MIVTTPDEIPVTDPVEVIVAKEVLLEAQFAAAGGVEPTKLIEEPTHTAVGPVIVGLALTVTVIVFEQPVFVVYVITAVPADKPETNPVFDTFATVELLELQLAAVPVPDH